MIARKLGTYAVIGLALAALSPSVSSQNTGKTPNQAEGSNIQLQKSISVRPGKLSGRILRRDSRAPVGGQIISVSAVGSGVVAEVKTSAAGAYSLPHLASGPYVMKIGEAISLPLTVNEDAVVETLDILVAKTTPVTKGPAKPLIQSQATIPLWGYIAGGVLLTAGIVWAAVELTDDDDEVVVSPSSSKISR